MKRIVLVAVLLLSAAAFAGVLRPDGAAADDPPTVTPDTVSVSGVGVVRAVPDRAEVSAGVETRAASAAAAMSANAAAMEDVIAALRDAGGKDVTTQVVSLSPTTDDTGRPNGFVASNSVSATTTLANAGALVDAAVDAGANTVWGPTLSRSDADELYRKALATAVDDAKLRAAALAAAAGREVGRVVAIVEQGATPGPLFAKAEAASDASTPIVSGPQETSATASVTFELR
jgi:uncharacterized protein YggE